MDPRLPQNSIAKNRWLWSEELIFLIPISEFAPTFYPYSMYVVYMYIYICIHTRVLLSGPSLGSYKLDLSDKLLVGPSFISIFDPIL